jgi:NADPH:quinone reductase-like Zn-dependent oxidoreductase
VSRGEPHHPDEFGGQISPIGVLAGRVEEVPTAALMARQARLRRLIVGNRRQQNEYVAALDASSVRPAIDRSFDFADLAKAFRYQESCAHFGKICAEW